MINDLEECCGTCENYDVWNGKCKKTGERKRCEELCDTYEEYIKNYRMVKI